MKLEQVIAILRDPNVSNKEAADAICKLPGSPLYKYTVALMWGAGRGKLVDKRSGRREQG